jgi:hypothetical protein
LPARILISLCCVFAIGRLLPLVFTDMCAWNNNKLLARAGVSYTRGGLFSWHTNSQHYRKRSAYWNNNRKVNNLGYSATLPSIHRQEHHQVGEIKSSGTMRNPFSSSATIARQIKLHSNGTSLHHPTRHSPRIESFLCAPQSDSLALVASFFPLKQTIIIKEFIASSSFLNSPSPSFYRRDFPFSSFARALL